MKRLFAACLCVVLLCVFSSCTLNADPVNIIGKTYCWEKEGAGSDFTITINQDGTMSYYAGLFSSYIGMGTWALEGDVLTITDDPVTGFQYINHFQVKDGDLVFIESESTGFMYVDVVDGDRFFVVEE